MIPVKVSLVAIIGFIFISIQCGEVQSRWGSGIIPNIKDILKKLGRRAFQDPVTRALCHLKTDELIKYYGYEAEVHNVTTEDGYVLTIFRCNSKKNSTENRKPVILQHSLLASSDEFCEAIPSQALAYVMADAGYDVWMPNARGNYYSRKHIYKNPNRARSKFWDFSWDDIGLNDYPAVYDYVRNQTNQTIFVIAHSQATSSTLALLSVKPEYNEYIRAVSLMAPIAYLKQPTGIWKTIVRTTPMLQLMKNREIMPRTPLNNIQGTMCKGILGRFCDGMVNALFGPSEDQRNNTMLPTNVCHNPSGASMNQFLHYFQEMKYGYFGPRMKRIRDPVPEDFPLHQVTAPVSLHYSTVDLFTDPEDMKLLETKLSYATEDLHVQRINDTVFNNADFVLGIHAADLVYSDILKFFAKH